MSLTFRFWSLLLFLYIRSRVEAELAHIKNFKDISTTNNPQNRKSEVNYKFATVYEKYKKKLLASLSSYEIQAFQRVDHLQKFVDSGCIKIYIFL